MLSRNDQPNINDFNFAVDSVFNNANNIRAFIIPPSGNNFLLLDGSNFLLLDGTDFVLL
jgi:hypothetical protein